MLPAVHDQDERTLENKAMPDQLIKHLDIQQLTTTCLSSGAAILLAVQRHPASPGLQHMPVQRSVQQMQRV